MILALQTNLSFSIETLKQHWHQSIQQGVAQDRLELPAFEPGETPEHRQYWYSLL